METNFRKRLINGKMRIGPVVALFTPGVSEVLPEI
jgi:hypothetical protein